MRFFQEIECTTRCSLYIEFFFAIMKNIIVSLFRFYIFIDSFVFTLQFSLSYRFYISIVYCFMFVFNLGFDGSFAFALLVLAENIIEFEEYSYISFNILAGNDNLDYIVSWCCYNCKLNYCSKLCTKGRLKLIYGAK